MTLLEEEESPKHTESKWYEQLWQYQQSSSAKLVHNKDRDGGSCNLYNPNYNGTNVGIKLAASILEYLDNVGADHFDSRKLLEEHQHKRDTEWLEIDCVAKNSFHSQNVNSSTLKYGGLHLANFLVIINIFTTKKSERGNSLFFQPFRHEKYWWSWQEVKADDHNDRDYRAYSTQTTPAQVRAKAVGEEESWKQSDNDLENCPHISPIIVMTCMKLASAPLISTWQISAI